MILKERKTKAFTLIEIMIVIAIIGILTAAILASLDVARAKARDGIRISDLRQIQGAVENYFSSCYQFPATTTDLVTGGNYCPNYTPVIPKLPADPLTGAPYSYFQGHNESGNSYHLCANLEKPNANAPGKANQGQYYSGGSDTCNGTLPTVYDLVGGALQ